MAKIYSAPDSITPPAIEHPFDYRKYQADTDKYVNDVIEHCKKTALKAGGQDMNSVGKVLQTPIADGYACYVVLFTKPFAIVHLTNGDGYRASAEWERGCNLTTLKKQIEFSKLFHS